MRCDEVDERQGDGKSSISHFGGGGAERGWSPAPAHDRASRRRVQRLVRQAVLDAADPSQDGAMKPACWAGRLSSR